MKQCVINKPDYLNASLILHKVFALGVLCVCGGGGGIKFWNLPFEPISLIFWAEFYFTIHQNGAQRDHIRY